MTSSVQAREEVDLLPKVSEIDEIKVKYEHRELGEISFTTDAAGWARIRKGLTPARVDRSPAKWETLGSLQILLTSGKTARVELYQVNRGAGAFAAGPDFKNRVYHRGGTTAALRRALDECLKKSKDATVGLQRATYPLRSGDRLLARVARDAGGFYPKSVTVGRDSVSKLGALANFEGTGHPRPSGELGTTMAADLTVERRGRVIARYQIRGDLLFFGPEFGWQAKLKDTRLFDTLKAKTEK